MKIVLIFPRLRYASGDPPLGLAYIASYIKKHSTHDIKIIDPLFQEIDYTADVYGIYITITMFSDALKIAEQIKEKNKNALVVAGGPNTTILPEETLKNPNIDVISIGEGELTFLDIVNNKDNLKKVKGIWYKENGKIVKNPSREPIKNLDFLPFPAFESLPMEKYIKMWFQLDGVKLKNIRGTNIITSRGCPYNCSFCQPTLRTIFGNKIRTRSAKNIIEEIIYLKKIFNINSISFEDDTFIFDKKRIYELCDLIIKNNLEINWICNVRANLVEESLLKKMKEAGLKKVAIGIESGSQRILDQIYHKQITLEQIRNAVHIIKKLGLKCRGYFMMGAPTETTAEINQTIELAKNLPLDEAMFSITTPLPHTQLYEKTKNLIGKDFKEFDYYKNTVYKLMSSRKLSYLRRKAILKFYLSPKRFKSTISELFNPIVLFYKLKRF